MVDSEDVDAVSGVAGISGEDIDPESVTTEVLNTDRWVSPGDSIQGVVDELESGPGAGRVILEPGTHTESGVSTTDTDIWFVGAGGHHGHTESVVWTRASDSPLLTLDGWRGRLEGIRFEGGGGSSGFTSDGIIFNETNRASLQWLINQCTFGNFDAVPAVVDITDAFFGRIANSYFRNVAGSAERGVRVPGGGGQILFDNNWFRGYNTAGVDCIDTGHLVFNRHISSSNAIGLRTNTGSASIVIAGQSNFEADVQALDLQASWAAIRDSDFWKCSADPAVHLSNNQEFIIENSRIRQNDHNGLDAIAVSNLILRNVQLNNNNQEATGDDDLVVRSSSTISFDRWTWENIGSINYDNNSIMPFEMPFARHLPILNETIAANTRETVGIIPARDFTGVAPRIYYLAIADHSNDDSGLNIRVQDTTTPETVASANQAYDHGHPMGSGSDDASTFEIQVEDTSGAERTVSGYVGYAWTNT